MFHALIVVFSCMKEKNFNVALFEVVYLSPTY